MTSLFQDVNRPVATFGCVNRKLSNITNFNQQPLNVSGYYIYAEASTPAKPDDVALLTSKEFPPSQCRCITWYYNMYGENMGELSMYVKDSKGDRRKLWSKKGDQGNKWISGEATISNVSNTNYQVDVE